MAEFEAMRERLLPEHHRADALDLLERRVRGEREREVALRRGRRRSGGRVS